MSGQIKTVGFIGLGVMGEPMCRNLATKAGLPVIGYDNVPLGLHRLVAQGVKAAHSVSAVGSAADIVFLSLPSGEVVAEVARAPEGLLSVCRPGQIVVDLSTSAVDIIRHLAKEFGDKGAHFVDAPVMRTRTAAEAGTLACCVGTIPSIFDLIRPLLGTFATDITYCGTVGCGAIVKLMNQMVLFQNVLALSEVHALAMAAGIDPKLLFDALSKGSADSFALRHHGIKAILRDDFPTNAFSVKYAKKDLRYALQLAVENGINVSGARNVDQWFDRAIQAGNGDQYFPVVSRLIAGEKDARVPE
jgi:3-hydroxyisobutyrate dehydrogenase-like beta-hydroxyacid dehydrogenase